MMDRRYWTAVGLLAVLAIASQLVVWLTRKPEQEQLFSGPPRSDYTLDQFELNALNSEGQLAFKVSGPRLARRGDDGSLSVDTPQFLILDGSGNTWHGDSESAWVNKDGSILQLNGKVAMRRDPTSQLLVMNIFTADLTTWPKDKRLQTAAPSHIEQPGSILRGIGMKADLNAHTFDLLANVHGSFKTKP